MNLYDYWSKASRYGYGLTYLKTRVTTNQKHIVGITKTKEKGTEAYYKRKPSNYKRKNKKEEKNKEEIQNQLENKV